MNVAFCEKHYNTAVDMVTTGMRKGRKITIEKSGSGCQFCRKEETKTRKPAAAKDEG